MADAEDDTPPPPPPPKKFAAILRTLLNGIGIFVLVLAAVVAGGFINTALHPLPELQLGKDGKIKPVPPPVPVAPAHHSEEASSAGKAPIYYAVDPPLVVNFEDGSVVRFLQISMEIMARDQKAIDSVQKNIPLIRNNLLLLMSNRNYESMVSREGKEKLRAEALAEVRAVQKKEGGPDVDDVLFTSFVVQ
jgi:flagellar FliL protein